jgi:hypothetical protein
VKTAPAAKKQRKILHLCNAKTAVVFSPTTPIVSVRMNFATGAASMRTPTGPLPFEISFKDQIK